MEKVRRDESRRRNKNWKETKKKTSLRFSILKRREERAHREPGLLGR